MNVQEVDHLFQYIESRAHTDGYITISDIYEYVGTDLDRDGKVSDLPLFRKSTKQKSKYSMVLE